MTEKAGKERGCYSAFQVACQGGIGNTQKPNQTMLNYYIVYTNTNLDCCAFEHALFESIEMPKSYSEDLRWRALWLALVRGMSCNEILCREVSLPVPHPISHYWISSSSSVH